MPVPYTTPGPQVLALRLARGWTLREAAKETGIPHSTLGYIETDKGNVTLDKLRQAVEALGGVMEIRIHAPPAVHRTGEPPDRFEIVQRIANLLPQLTPSELDMLLNEIALYEQDAAKRKP